MPRYLISYDLNTPGRNYKKLYDELDQLGGRRVLLSQWALRNDATAVDLCNHFWQFLDGNDRLLVSDLDRVWASQRAMIDINTV